MHLSNLVAYKILNSRKEETIAVLAEILGKKARVEASAPSGASKGEHEVQDFSSRGIDFSINLLNVIGRKLVSGKISFETFQDLEKIEKIAKQYDQTKTLDFIGGNALYALEAAIIKAMAVSQEQKVWQFLLQDKKPVMPMPLGNCIGGGMHIKQERKTDFQEFLLLPKTKNFFDVYFANMQAYKKAKVLLKKKDEEWKGTLTDENALAATLDNESVLILLQEIRQKIKESLDVDIDLGIDMAASTFWQASKYRYKNFSKSMKEKNLAAKEQLSYIAEIAENNNLAYLEDPLQQEDFGSFAKLTAKNHMLVCGDDLTCTHIERVEKAIKEKAINALIIKPNQVGSFLEAKKIADFARKHDIKTIISHRSGETEDNLIAHLAVGWQIPIIKTGIIGKERLAKLNELLRIEKEIS